MTAKKAETVQELVEHIQKKLALLEEWQENYNAIIELMEGGCYDETDQIHEDRLSEIEEELKEEYSITLDKDHMLYDALELLECNSQKLELLQEWQECIEKAIALSKKNKFEESDEIDNRCIEIESYFETEYGIKFDSYGDMYED